MEIRHLKNPFPTMHEAPHEVWIEGDPSAFRILEELPERGLAVVGTRAPQKRSEMLTRETISYLRGSDLTILSGLARGIDAIAHESALGAGLPTIAVLASGIDQTYPPEHVDLRKRILDAGGLILTEFKPGTEPLRAYFTRRNRIIAGLAKATWIVQAGKISGALNTAHWAMKNDRRVYATPCFPGDPALAGNEMLLSQKQAIPLWSMDDFSQTWFGLIHFFSQVNPPKNRKKNSAHKLQAPLLVLEKRLREGATLAEALLDCSRLLSIPVDELLQHFEKSKIQA